MTFYHRQLTRLLIITLTYIFFQGSSHAVEKKPSTSLKMRKVASTSTKSNTAVKNPNKKTSSSPKLVKGGAMSSPSVNAQLKSPNSGFKSYNRFPTPVVTSNDAEPIPTPNIIDNALLMPVPEVVKPLISDATLTLRKGCAPIPTGGNIREFLEALAINDRDFEESFTAQLPNFFKNTSGNCLPFALSLDRYHKVQSLSILNNDKRDARTTLSTIYKSETSMVYLVDSQTLNTGFENYLELTLDLNDLINYKPSEANASLPPELIWEIRSLVRELHSKINSNDHYFARIIYNAGDKNTWAQVISLEILDSAQKTVLGDAFWVNREDIPGGFFTSNGTELEQNFWTSPLNYTRISRGVGGSSILVNRPVRVKQGKTTKIINQTYTYSTSHQGIDFAAPIGTPVFAVANGKIIHYGPFAGYGNLVIIEHPGNYKTYYAHLSAYNPELEVGSVVRRGLEIGYVGSTGHSTGPHLHFELRKNNVYLNPLASRLELDLWSLRNDDLYRLTRNIVLFSSQVTPK